MAFDSCARMQKKKKSKAVRPKMRRELRIMDTMAPRRALWALLVPRHLTKEVKTALEEDGLLDKSTRISKYVPLPDSSLGEQTWMVVQLIADHQKIDRWLENSEQLEEADKIFRFLDS